MSEIEKLEQEIMEKTQKLWELRKKAKPVAVKNYQFKNQNGDVSLLDLFGDKKILFLIHNMGQGCRYCTTWADGLNGFLPHLESQYAVALVSKDPPDLQRAMANSRGWRFQTASHGGGAYAKENSTAPGEKNAPGLVVYERKGSKIYKKNSTAFGPGDLYCSLWNVLALAGISESEFTPQFSYWKRPQKTDMEDGGQNLD